MYSRIIYIICIYTTYICTMVKVDGPTLKRLPKKKQYNNTYKSWPNLLSNYIIYIYIYVCMYVYVVYIYNKYISWGSFTYSPTFGSCVLLSSLKACPNIFTYQRLHQILSNTRFMRSWLRPLVHPFKNSSRSTSRMIFQVTQKHARL